MTAGSGPVPSPGVAGRSGYRVPGHGAPIDLFLHGNEGAGPGADVFEALAGADVELLRRYPDPSGLEAALAARCGVAPEQVVVTAGGDDALDRAFRAFLAPGRDVILPYPSFVMLDQYATLVGATARRVSWPDGAWPQEAVLSQISGRTGAICVVTPNNPTGAVVDEAALRALSAAAPRAALLVDLAYTEFADVDLTGVVRSLPNAIQFRTLSKAWGLAGARVGYAVGPAELIGYLRAAGNPYAVSAPSIALALRRLATGEEAMRAYVARAKSERVALRAALRAIGGDAPESQGNFAFARMPTREGAQWLTDAMAGLGVKIRLLQLGDGAAVRVTCPGDDAALARVLDGIAAAFDPARWVASGSASELAAARAQGRVPIGLTGGDAAEALTAAGAARIVGDLAELRGIVGGIDWNALELGIDDGRGTADIVASLRDRDVEQ